MQQPGQTKASPAAPTQERAARVRRIAGEVLGAFELLKALSAIGVARHGLTMSLRALLQDLYDKGPRTVPQIATGRTMTRQAIQLGVDQLRSRGLAETLANPAHRRSPIIALTDAGRRLFEAIRAREAEALGSLAAGLAGYDLDSACETLTAFRHELEARLELRKREAANGDPASP